MDKKYKKLIEILNKNNLTKVSYEEKGKKWMVERAAKSTSHNVLSSENTNTYSNTSAPLSSENAILAPILGTFYKAPSTGKKPFVKVGDKVKVGQTLFIIEAMKVMNEIKSTHNGKVTKIFFEDGDLVEYNAQVMIIE